MSEQIAKAPLTETLHKRWQWHNRWRVRIPYDGVPAGHEYFDCDKWPSMEVAEQKAREEIAWDAAHGDALIEDWMGAFPVPVEQTP